MPVAEGSVAVGVQAVYDAVASAHDSQLGDELDHKPLGRALLAGFAELAGGGKVADVGCGPGHVTRFIAEQHPDVVGIDLSPRMVAIARERAPGLTFVVGLMWALPAGDEVWRASSPSTRSSISRRQNGRTPAGSSPG